MEWETLILTTRLALFTTLILIAICFPLAYWLSASKSRWKVLIEAMVALPLVLPPTVIGYYLLICMSPISWIGNMILSLTGEKLAFSFEGILIASVLFNFPFMMQPLMSAFARFDRRFLEASWCLGRSKIMTMIHIVIPLCRAGIIHSMVLTFTHAIGEFGVVLMIGGNIPGVTRTLSISVYDNVQSLNYEAANQTSMILIGFSFFALLVTYMLHHRVFFKASQ